MAFNFNQSTLGGRLTTTPELKITGANNSNFCKFTIAVKQNAEQSDFFTCIAWEKTAQFITRNFEKGSQICVVGEWHNRTYTDRNGTERKETEFTVKSAYFVDNAKTTPTAFDAQQGEEQIDQQPKWEEIPSDDELPF